MLGRILPMAIARRPTGKALKKVAEDVVLERERREKKKKTTKMRF